MIASGSISRARLVGALAWAGVACLFCATGQAGEKIRFSDRSTTVDLPMKGADDLKPSPLQDFLGSRRSEMGAPDIFSFTPPRRSLTARDKREQERRLEEKKNWIMHDAESIRGDRNQKEPADTQSEDEPGKERKPRTLMERVAEERERKSQSNTNQFNNGFRPDNRSLDFTTRPNASATNRTELMNAAQNNSAAAREQKGDDRPSARLPADARAGQAGLPDSNGTGPSGLSILARTERLRQQDERAAELRKLLDSPGAVSTAPRRGADLLNSPDTTRQEINPIIGRGLNEFSPRIDLKRGFDPIGSSSRPSILNELIPSGFGSPGVGPSLLLPTEPLRMERRPVVLEIPKRKI